MRTLHTYFGKELLKTFLMTSAALTLLIVMGGGVANLFRGEGVGAGQMAKIVLYLGPVAVTLILPVAALFSSTITYGRATMDNEILACRAAGINIHRLLLSPLILGLFVTVFTYGSWNYLIPYLTGAIEDITRRDLPSIVVGQFQKGKPLAYGKYRITSDHCQAVPTEQLPEEVREGHTFLRLLGVAFLELEDQEVMRFGTADETIIDFDNTGITPRVTVDMQGGRSFDAARRQYFEFNHQILGPIDIPLPIKRKIKFETLGTLLKFKDDPMLIPEIQDLLHGMRRAMSAFFLSDEIAGKMETLTTFSLAGKDFHVDIAAERYLIDESESRTKLGGVHVRLTPSSGDPATLYAADEAIIELRSGLDRSKYVILIELNGNVRISREPAGPDDLVVQKNKEALPKVAFEDQQALQERFTSFDMASLFDKDFDLPIYPKQERMRRKLVDRLERYASEVRGEIHFRSSYSLGAIAIVLLGAMLGIIVRGGQVLTAFGISCVPMLFVIVASIVGRNLADRPDYSLASAGVMWGSTVFLYLAATTVGAKILTR
jgi:lipopolysaccharide export LptBFGC system permease protein LptF